MKAKFRLTEKAELEGGAFRVKFTASAGKGNETWSKWTPSGSIEMVITNPVAVESLEVGRHYHLNFSPAEGGEA